ncbi:tetratricopeptide repeat protein [Pontixanthobacter aquaemixtae]|uniref:Sel1 repeat family protein n=1 Tax=Pontixanthobacter aquaemixtae TaxID=1958940 RepID=A0A844ZSF4_9SPHN|nr:tetratricopeptide repeat protein [Pontixanthobacter aquaemixtae]MXO90242.1 hypothetical protein [Pontixanthobacter aquaemixtae]
MRLSQCFAYGTAALIAISAAPASAQLTYNTCYSDECDAKLIEQFQGDPEHRAYLGKAKAGDPYAMLKIEHAVRTKLAGTLNNRNTATEMRMKLLVGAMQKNYPEAFGRMGDMIYRQQLLPEATIEDAFGFYLQGTELGDETSTVMAVRLAKDPVACIGCSKLENGTLKLELPEGAMFDIDEIKKAGDRYLATKADMVKRVIAALEASYQPKSTIGTTSLINFYLSGVGLPHANYYDYNKRFVFDPDGKRAEQKLKEVAAADPGDSWAPSLLGFYYASPKDSGIKKNPKEAARYLDMASRAGDKGSAKTAQIYGHELVTGKLFPENVPLAVEYLELSYNAGNADAAYDLGLLNYLGKGIPRNYAKAEAYFRTSMGRKHVDGTRMLATMFREGTANRQSDLLANEYERRANTFEQSKPQCDENNLMTIDCLIKYGSN